MYIPVSLKTRKDIAIHLIKLSNGRYSAAFGAVVNGYGFHSLPNYSVWEEPEEDFNPCIMYEEETFEGSDWFKIINNALQFIIKKYDEA